MKWIGRAFLAGLAAIVPVAATLYLIYWLAAAAETTLGDPLRILLPEGWYWPGMGLGAGLLLVFLIGLLMHAWLVQRLYGRAESLLYRIPLIRSVYGSMRDLYNLFLPTQEQGLHQTVVLSWGGIRLIGFITRQDLSDLPPGIGAADDVIVLLPMSYNVGGYIVVVPRSAVHPIDMSVEDALRFTLTAGITGIQGKQPHGKEEPEKPGT